MNAQASFPPSIHSALQLAHPSWYPALRAGLAAVAQADPAYLQNLSETFFLPTENRLFAAFSQPLEAVRYVLVGEGPYPRSESATGYCFMDGAVKEIWSHEMAGGLSKKVNRATSLRNFMKMLLVAAGYLHAGDTRGAAIAAVAERARDSGSGLIQTQADLQRNLLDRGFLLLNAALVFRSEVAPAKEAKAWQAFLQVILSALCEQQEQSGQTVTLVLWGKIAEQLKQLPAMAGLRQTLAEHPYNLSFIANQTMQNLFGPMRLLEKTIL